MAKAPEAGSSENAPLPSGCPGRGGRAVALLPSRHHRARGEVRDVAPSSLTTRLRAAPLFRALAPEFAFGRSTGPIWPPNGRLCRRRPRAGATAVVLIGTDAPHVPAEQIRLAVRLLGEGAHDVVLGPSEDGGYI